jgi:hypothetical protein
VIRAVVEAVSTSSSEDISRETERLERQPALTAQAMAHNAPM